MPSKTARLAPLALVALFALSACAHLKGAVTEEGSDHPMRSAVFTVGRPNGIAIYDRHTVTSDGSFDFYVLLTDEDDLYLFDGLADPELTMRRVAPSEFSDHMRLSLPAARHSAGPGGLGLPANLP